MSDDKYHEYGRVLTNQALAETVEQLKSIHDDVWSVYSDLEDDERIMSHRRIGEQFVDVMGRICELIGCIEDADRVMRLPPRKRAKKPS